MKKKKKEVAFDIFPPLPPPPSNLKGVSFFSLEDSWKWFAVCGFKGGSETAVGMLCGCSADALRMLCGCSGILNGSRVLQFLF